jgi:5-methylcytosine-specific restriction protein A
VPDAPKRPCSVYPCAGLADYRGKCRVHSRIVEQRRGSSSARGYDSTWRKLRAMKLAADPLCQIRTHCKGMLPDSVAVEVDHIVPIARAPGLRLRWDNLQSACRACHQAKTWAENQGEA